MRSTAGDLPSIYGLQDIPQRDLILTSHLLPYSDFITRAELEMNANRKFYCLLEMSDQPAGFLWISKPDETCEIWGRHLHTLFYACAWFAFERLGMKRLNWNVRIRKTGGDFIFTSGKTFAEIITGTVHYYQFDAEEYYERVPLMEKYSINRSTFQDECGSSFQSTKLIRR